MKPCFLPFAEHRRLQDRASRAQQRDNSEVCGALLMNVDRVLRLQFMTNQAGTQGAWSLRSRDLPELRRELATSAWRVMGTFHSHPLSEAIPGTRGF